MAKVVYNTCYGGFGLSDAAIQRYADLKGIAIHKRPTGYADRSYWAYTETDEYFDRDDIVRHDRALVQVVEELGEQASGDAADLCIREIPDGARYRVEEYDGTEWVVLETEQVWETAL
jgi:hypothetical protein